MFSPVGIFSHYFNIHKEIASSFSFTLMSLIEQIQFHNCFQIIKATSNHIYVTDLGNGCVLDTDTKLWVTKKLNLPQGRKLMGVEVDPSENFIIATSHNQDREWICNLEVFNPKGKFI